MRGAYLMHWFWRAAIAVGVASVFAFAIYCGGFYVVYAITGMDDHPGLWGLIAGAMLIGFICCLATDAVLRRVNWSRPIDPETRCRKCGYILRGITEPRCPECGEHI